MGMISEFKAFAVRGNVIDMAVGIIVGAAFTKIVSSFVADVVTPPLGMLIGGVDFSDLAIVLKQAVGDTPAVTLSYGRFIQTVRLHHRGLRDIPGGQGDQSSQTQGGGSSVSPVRTH